MAGNRFRGMSGPVGLVLCMGCGGGDFKAQPAPGKRQQSASSLATRAGEADLAIGARRHGGCGDGDGCFAADPEVRQAIGDALGFAAQRLDATIADLKSRYPQDYWLHYPAFTVTSGPSLGQWSYRGAADWRSGFFPGALGHMYEATGDAVWLAESRSWGAGIESMKSTSVDHDLGFRFCQSFALDDQLSDEGNDPGRVYRDHARDVLLTAAATLDTRFNENGIPVGALRSEDDYPPGSTYPVYIDSMMNLCLFWQAWELSHRPDAGPARTWYEHAVAQATTILAQNVRPDGSTYHIVEHDDGTGGTPPDGKVSAKITDQGFAPESTWSRGQAWAIYGYAMAYRYTRHDQAARPGRFLRASERTADYFLAHLPDRYLADPFNHRPGDLVPPADFDAALGEPDGPYSTHRAGTKAFTRRDSSAAAVAAAGLLQLCTLFEERERRQKYFDAAQEILGSLLSFRGSDGKLAYLARDSVHQGILAGGSVAWDPNQDTGSLIYGDDFFLEAILRYRALTGGR